PGLSHFEINPPSTTSVSPVMYEPASLANKSAGPINSFGSPQRSRIVVFANSAFSVAVSRFIGRSVKHGPGAKQLTVMPKGPRSIAHPLAKPMSADFVAEYGARPPFDTNPMIDEI